MNYSNYFTNYKLIAIISCLLIAGIVSIFVLWPLFQEFKAAQQNLANKRIELENKENYLSKLIQIKQQLEEYEKEIDNILAAVPSSPSLPSLFHHLQQLASEAGLVFEEIGSFSTAPSEDVPGLQTTSFNLKLVGPYSSIKNFLFSTEQSSRLIITENISFSSSQDEEAGQSFNFNLNMKVYSK